MVIATLLSKYPHKQELIGDIVEEAARKFSTDTQFKQGIWCDINKSVSQGKQ